MFSGR
jgi:cytochrome P450